LHKDLNGLTTRHACHTLLLHLQHDCQPSVC